MLYCYICFSKRLSMSRTQASLQRGTFLAGIVILNKLYNVIFLSRETEGLARRCLGSGLKWSAVPNPAG